MSQHQVTTRQRRNVVLLDLDGTLTQSDPGIIACATKAFEELGLPVPDDQEMHRFIGPAIIESFRRNHMPDELLDRGVEIYREYYADKAVFDDPNNPGHKIPGRLHNSVRRYSRAAGGQVRPLAPGNRHVQAAISGRASVRVISISG